MTVAQNCGAYSIARHGRPLSLTPTPPKPAPAPWRTPRAAAIAREDARGAQRCGQAGGRVGSLPPDCQCGLFAWERHSASSNALSSEHPATRRGLLQAHGCMRGVPTVLRGRAGSAARARRGGARTWRRAAALLDRALQREQRARLAHRTARARARAHLREPAAGRALRVRAPPALKKALGGPITQNPEGLPWPLPGAGRCAVVCCSAGRDEACAHPVRGLAVFLHAGGVTSRAGSHPRSASWCAHGAARGRGGAATAGRAVWQAGPMGSLR